MVVNSFNYKQRKLGNERVRERSKDSGKVNNRKRVGRETILKFGT